MEVPAQVTRNAKTADDMIANLKAGIDPSAVSPAPDAPAQPGTTQAAPPTLPQAQQPPTTPPSTPPPAAQAADTWEQRYKTLQGKYNAEVPNLARELRDNRELVARLTAEMEVLKQAKAPQQTGSETVPPDTPKKYEESDFAQYGDEFGTLFREKKALEEKVARMETFLASLNQERVMSAEERFFAAVVKDVPNWEQINVEPGFLGFLAQIHPYTGRPRHDSLTAARSSLNAAQVIAIFKEYSGSAGVQAQPQPPAAPQTPLPPVNAQINPGPGKFGQNYQGKVWTRQEISAFYNGKMRGEFRGRDAEALAIENDIFAAQSEGRVAI